MFLYLGKVYKIILTFFVCSILLIFQHFDMNCIRMIFLKNQTFEVHERKMLNVAFYFNVIPVDAGGQVMEFDWISNFLLGKIDRPVKILTGDEALNKPRNDTLHVFLGHPHEMTMFRAFKRNKIVNQGKHTMWLNYGGRRVKSFELFVNLSKHFKLLKRLKGHIKIIKCFILNSTFFRRFSHGRQFIQERY